MKICLVGNPNSGKTTLFNALTGSNQYVGNWPGVTVEKKEGHYRRDKDVVITDLPGIYSLSPYSLEEIITRNYLVDEMPEGIINIVDASNLERNLYLTTQILELHIPTVLAVNMMDILEKRGDSLDLAELSRKLGIPVIGLSAIKKDHIEEVVTVLKQEILGGHKPKLLPLYDDEIVTSLEEIKEIFLRDISADLKDFYAVKLLEKDEKTLEKLAVQGTDLENLTRIVSVLETKTGDDTESLITSSRYRFIEENIAPVFAEKNRNSLTLSDKIDRLLTNRLLALPIFALIMYAVYYVSVETVGSAWTDWVNENLFTEIIPPVIENLLLSIHCADWLMSLILDGIVAGVGAVLGFLPQMVVLFICLALLEECGYMARIAFIMDRIFRRFGLSGKSFIPMMIGTGCGVPAVMASRTIESERDRRMTVMTTTFIPCSAKLPVIAMIAGALFNESGLVSVSAYFLGIFAIVTSGIILKKTKPFLGDPSPFIMELPAYHLPRFGNVFRSVWDRSGAFVKKAGTIILLSTIFVHVITHFGWYEGQFMYLAVESEEGLAAGLIDGSIAAKLGSLFGIVFMPLGFGDWRSTVATLTGLVAKENVVATFGILFRTVVESEEGVEFWPTLASTYTVVSGYSLLVFNLLCAPCFAAIGAIKREMANQKWTWIAIAWECGYAYVIAFIIYHFGNALVFRIFNIWTVLAAAVAMVFLYFLFRRTKREISH